MVRNKKHQAFWSPLTSGTHDGWANPNESDWGLVDLIDFDTWRWVSQANCRGIDPEDFFRAEGSLRKPVLTDICAACPVREECLEYALLHDEHGWWGGTSRRERHKIMNMFKVDSGIGIGTDSGTDSGTGVGDG